MACRSSVPQTTVTHSTERPRGISYETICAAERMVPKTLYLLFELHPAIMMPITSRETMAMRKKTPEEMAAPDHDGLRGSTAKPANTETKMMTGAVLKSQRSAFA